MKRKISLNTVHKRRSKFQNSVSEYQRPDLKFQATNGEVEELVEFERLHLETFIKSQLRILR